MTQWWTWKIGNEFRPWIVSLRYVLLIVHLTFMSTLAVTPEYRHMTCIVEVWSASAFIIRNSDTYKQLFYIMYRVSILWGEKAGGRKWDDQMGEWSGARGCPENGMLVDRGKGWPGIRAWMNVRVECGSHGNGEMEMGSKMEQFHWLFNCTYLQTQYPSPCWKRSR